MSNRLRRVYANVDDETFAELEQRAKETHRTLSYLVRVGIDSVLNELDPDRDQDGATSRVRAHAGPPSSRSHPSGSTLRPVR